MSTIKDLGVILFASELKAVKSGELLLACETAAIPRQLVSDVRPKNAFIRAVRALQTNGVGSQGRKRLLHKFTDDNTAVRFQFSDVYLQQLGVRYEANAVVSFDKKTHGITCDSDQIRRHAERFYAEAHEHVLPSDIYALVKRYVDQESAKRIPLRDGVYFLPLSKAHVAENLKKFFTALNFPFFLLPVNAADAANRAEIIKATVEDVGSTVKAIAQEIAELKASDKLTQRVACNRLRELHNQLKQYTELASALSESTENLLEQAGNAGKALLRSAGSVEELIACVESGEHVPGFIYDLVAAASEETTLPPRDEIVTEAVDVPVDVFTTEIELEEVTPVF
jgi:hypothetical protein